MSGAAAARTICLNVNGEERSATAEPRVTLVDFLRHGLRLTGTHVGCEQGVCGACTVLIDGFAVRGCLMLAVQAEGRQVQTIESLGTVEAPHALQRAFSKHHALQCGYCTPGQLCSGTAMLDEVRHGAASALTVRGGNTGLSDADIRERMSGNICRCGAYTNIVAALRQASGRDA